MHIPQNTQFEWLIPPKFVYTQAIQKQCFRRFHVIHRLDQVHSLHTCNQSTGVLPLLNIDTFCLMSVSK